MSTQVKLKLSPENYAFLSEQANSLPLSHSKYINMILTRANFAIKKGQNVVLEASSVISYGDKKENNSEGDFFPIRLDESTFSEFEKNTCSEAGVSANDGIAIIINAMRLYQFPIFEPKEKTGQKVSVK